MPEPGMVILYVESAPASAAFYEALLGHPPVEASPGFAMFVLRTGARLGLWTRAGVAPAAVERAGAMELAFSVPDVDAAHAEWVARGLRMLQAPVTMEFGRTFTALDPDGHRLRVLAAEH